jgi:uncharacterized protein
MESLYRATLAGKIVDCVTSERPLLTGRDVWVPSIPKKALAVIGIRRAGKTSFLWQLIAQKVAMGVPREALVYVSFEDERLSGMKALDLGILLEEYTRLYPSTPTQKATFFLDEIQRVEGWEVFVRRAMDAERINFVLCGSSARLLSREVATSMRGRAMEAVVHPFSFRETLRHQQLEPSVAPSHMNTKTRALMQHAFAGYLRVGGFPEAQGTDDANRQALLTGYVDVVLLRDVIERHAVSNPIALRMLVRMLLANPAGMFSINKFFNDLKSQSISIAKETLHAYLAYLEDAFLVHTVSIHSDSEKQRQVNPRKVYPADMGLIPFYERGNRANVGHALESAVAIELLRRRAKLSYVKAADGFEVDFLAQYPDGSQELIQACASLDAEATQQREFRALHEVSASSHQQFAATPKTVIVIDIPPQIAVPKGIRVVQAADWFLDQKR